MGKTIDKIMAPAFLLAGSVSVGAGLKCITDNLQSIPGDYDNPLKGALAVVLGAYVLYEGYRAIKRIKKD